MTSLYMVHSDGGFQGQMPVWTGCVALWYRGTCQPQPDKQHAPLLLTCDSSVTCAGFTRDTGDGGAVSTLRLPKPVRSCDVGVAAVETRSIFTKS